MTELFSDPLIEGEEYPQSYTAADQEDQSELFQGESDQFLSEGREDIGGDIERNIERNIGDIEEDREEDGDDESESDLQDPFLGDEKKRTSSRSQVSSSSSSLRREDRLRDGFDFDFSSRGDNGFNNNNFFGSSNDGSSSQLGATGLPVLDNIVRRFSQRRFLEFAQNQLRQMYTFTRGFYTPTRSNIFDRRRPGGLTVFRPLAEGRRLAPRLFAANSPSSVLLNNGTHLLPLLVGVVPFLHVRMDGNVHIAFQRRGASSAVFSGRVQSNVGLTDNINSTNFNEDFNINQGALSILLNFTENQNTQARALSTLGFTFSTHLIFTPQAVAYLRRNRRAPALGLQWQFEQSLLNQGARVAFVSRSTLNLSLLGSNPQPSSTDDGCVPPAHHHNCQDFSCNVGGTNRSQSSGQGFDASDLFRLQTEQTSPLTRSVYPIKEDDFWDQYDRTGTFPDIGEPIAEYPVPSATPAATPSAIPSAIPSQSAQERKQVDPSAAVAGAGATAASSGSKLFWPCRKASSLVSRCFAALDEL